MEVSIRKMEESDLDRIMEIERSTFTTAWSRDSFIFELENNLLAHYIVGLVDGEVAGYGGVWFIVDEGHITNIAVEEKYRGLGVGKKILEGIINLAESSSIGGLTLEVRKSNKVAQCLYKKYGFVEEGIRPNYYRDDNEDALIMWKIIESISEVEK